MPYSAHAGQLTRSSCTRPPPIAGQRWQRRPAAEDRHGERGSNHRSLHARRSAGSGVLGKPLCCPLLVLRSCLVKMKKLAWAFCLCPACLPHTAPRLAAAVAAIACHVLPSAWPRRRRHQPSPAPCSPSLPACAAFRHQVTKWMRLWNIIRLWCFYWKHRCGAGGCRCWCGRCGGAGCCCWCGCGRHIVVHDGLRLWAAHAAHRPPHRRGGAALPSSRAPQPSSTRRLLPGHSVLSSLRCVCVPGDDSCYPHCAPHWLLCAPMCAEGPDHHLASLRCVCVSGDRP